MNWEQYLIESERTLNKMGSVDDLIHAGIGINTEIGELIETFTQSHKREELGDIFWYMAIFYRELNIESIPYFDFTKELCENNISKCYFSLQEEGYKLLDQVKRIKFYKKDIDSFDIGNLPEINLLLSHIITQAGF